MNVIMLYNIVERASREFFRNSPAIEDLDFEFESYEVSSSLYFRHYQENGVWNGEDLVEAKCMYFFTPSKHYVTVKWNLDEFSYSLCIEKDLEDRNCSAVMHCFLVEDENVRYHFSSALCTNYWCEFGEKIADKISGFHEFIDCIAHPRNNVLHRCI